MFLPLAVLAGSDESIGEAVIGWFKELGSAIVGMLKAPFVAISSIFSGWADTLSQSWFAPIVMAVVIIITLVIVYFGFSAIEKLPGQ